MPKPPRVLGFDALIFFSASVFVFFVPFSNLLPALMDPHLWMDPWTHIPPVPVFKERPVLKAAPAAARKRSQVSRTLLFLYL